MSVAFLEAWRRRETSLPTDKVLPWLFGIAMNVVRNHQRSQRRFLRALLRTPLPQPEPSFDERTDERLDDEAQMRSALQALSGLPKREQDVFVLCAWSGLSYEDAALALDVPVGTIRSRLSRARARLLELEPDFGHEESTTRPVQEAVEP
jgi:RNA polymerase sigma-70 factor (ECF subfamily)